MARRRFAGLPLVVVVLAGCSSNAVQVTTPRPPVANSSSTAIASVVPTSSEATVPSSLQPRPTPSRPSTPTPTTPVPSRSAPPLGHSAFTVVLNPGHDGGDAAHTAEISRLVPEGYGRYKACDTTGTETNAGYPEHAFNWDVALRVRRILREQGVRVILTRPSDTGVGPCVDQRAAIGNQPGVDAVVSIHADGAPSSGHGFHVNQDSRRPQGATAAVAHDSIELGRAIHAALVRSSGLVPSTYIGQDGYYYRDDLAGLNLATKPATFLELGNMRNAGDAGLQSSTQGRARIAAAVAAGILAFLGL